MRIKSLFLCLLLTYSLHAQHSPVSSISVANQYPVASGGTTTGKLVVLDSTGLAIQTAATSSLATLGIALATSSSGAYVYVTQSGPSSCVMDDTSVVNDFITISTSVAGDCHDTGVASSAGTGAVGAGIPVIGVVQQVVTVGNPALIQLSGSSTIASSGFNLPAGLAASPQCITTGNAGQLLTPDSSNNGQIDCVPTVVVSPSTITGSALGHVLWSLNVGGGGTLDLNNTSGTNEIALAGSSGSGTFKNVAAGGTSAFINPSAAYAFGSSGLGNANVGFTQYVNSTSGEIDVATPSTGALGTRTITLPVPVGSTATFCYNDGTGCPSSAAGITVGTTTITGGNSGCLLYDSGGLLNCTSLVDNGVYTTSNTGAPVASTTLPGGLSINTGGISFLNATSGFIKITPPTGALGSQTLTLPDTSSTLCAGDGTGCPSSFPSTSITPGTTTIIGASAPCAITNTTSTTMGCNGFTGTGLIVRTQSPTIDTLGVSTQFNVTAGSNLFAISSAGVAIGGNSTVNMVALGNATSGANFNSTPFAQCGNTWTGSAAIADCWTWQDVAGTGSNPTSTYTLTHSGSSGTSRLSLPATILANLSTATTQSPGDNSTKVATTAYVDTALGTGTIENQIPKGTGTGLTESSLTDDGTTVTTAEVFKVASSPVSNNDTTVPTTADVRTALGSYTSTAALTLNSLLTNNTTGLTFGSYGGLITAVACAGGYSCSSQDGTVNITGSFAGSGVAFVMTWPATANTPKGCNFFQQNNPSALSGFIQTTTPTTTGVSVYAVAAVVTGTLLGYHCWY